MYCITIFICVCKLFVCVFFQTYFVPFYFFVAECVCVSVPYIHVSVRYGLRVFGIKY